MHTVPATQSGMEARSRLQGLAECATCIFASWPEQDEHISWWARNSCLQLRLQPFPSPCTWLCPLGLWYGPQAQSHQLACLRMPGLCSLTEGPGGSKHGAHTKLCTFITYYDDNISWDFLDHMTGDTVVSRDVTLAVKCIQIQALDCLVRAIAATCSTEWPSPHHTYSHVRLSQMMSWMWGEILPQH